MVTNVIYKDLKLIDCTVDGMNFDGGIPRDIWGQTKLGQLSIGDYVTRAEDVFLVTELSGTRDNMMWSGQFLDRLLDASDVAVAMCGLIQLLKETDGEDPSSN